MGLIYNNVRGMQSSLVLLCVQEGVSSMSRKYFSIHRFAIDVLYYLNKHFDNIIKTGHYLSR